MSVRVKMAKNVTNLIALLFISVELSGLLASKTAVGANLARPWLFNPKDTADKKVPFILSLIERF